MPLLGFYNGEAAHCIPVLVMVHAEHFPGHRDCLRASLSPFVPGFDSAVPATCHEHAARFNVFYAADGVVVSPHYRIGASIKI